MFSLLSCWFFILSHKIKGSNFLINSSSHPFILNIGWIWFWRYFTSSISKQNSMQILINLLIASSYFSLFIEDGSAPVLITVYWRISPFNIYPTLLFLSFSSIGMSANVIFLPLYISNPKASASIHSELCCKLFKHCSQFNNFP